MEPAHWLGRNRNGRGLLAGLTVSEEQASLDHQFPEYTMLSIHGDESRPGRVTVAFTDSALSFTLAKDATLEDLACRLDRLGELHNGKPVAIEVKFGALPDAYRRRLRDSRISLDPE
jgi:hypothetical protein